MNSSDEIANFATRDCIRSLARYTTHVAIAVRLLVASSFSENAAGTTTRERISHEQSPSGHPGLTKGLDHL